MHNPGLGSEIQALACKPRYESETLLLRPRERLEEGQLVLVLGLGWLAGNGAVVS